MKKLLPEIMVESGHARDMSEAFRQIREGKVSVNNEVVTSVSTMLDGAVLNKIDFSDVKTFTFSD